MKYSEKLKDKRWQERRYEIIKRDRATCKICGYIGPKLNVHHLKYTGDPWDAPDEDLILLCKECHRTVHLPEINDKRYEKMHVRNWLRKLINNG